jgi:tripartite-type tricarboxylate transporter receptor subunit TctC
MAGRFTRRDVLVSGVAAAGASLLAAPAIAQGWPAKPIRLVIGDAPGGGSDQVSRVFVEYISKRLGQPVVPENRPGANGVVAATEVKNAAPDGYTLLYMVGSALMTQKILHKNLPYDPVKDFEPVAASPVAGIPLIVSVASGAKTLEQFVEYARKKGTANIGTYGAGSLAHVGIAAMERFFMAPFTAVHYRSSALMFADLAVGSLDGGIGSGTVGMNVITIGKGTALAIQGRNRIIRYPDVPTFLELGGTDPGLSLMSVTGILAPAGVPDQIINKISELAVEAGRDEATWQKFMTVGAEQRSIGRAEFKRWVTEEGPVWAQMVGGLGISN